MIARDTNIRRALREKQRGFLLNPFRFGGGGPADPNRANVSLHLHFDGADGSTTFTDNSPNAFTVTPFGNAQIDTAQSKFGGASGLFDGTGDYLTAPNDTDFNFGSGNWTIESFIRPASLPAFSAVVSKRATSADYSPFFPYFTSTGAVGLLCSSSGTSWQVNIVTANLLSINNWYHLAFVRNGNIFSIYVDGVSGASTTQSITLMTNAQPVTVGVGTAAADSPINAHMDELRITKGVARYTANFTPPTAAFPDF